MAMLDTKKLTLAQLEFKSIDCSKVTPFLALLAFSLKMLTPKSRTWRPWWKMYVHVASPHEYFTLQNSMHIYLLCIRSGADKVGTSTDISLSYKFHDHKLDAMHWHSGGLLWPSLTDLLQRMETFSLLRLLWSAQNFAFINLVFVARIFAIFWCLFNFQLFSTIDQDKDDIISISDMNATSRAEWRKFVLAFEGEPGLKAGYSFEFGFVDYETLW